MLLSPFPFPFPFPFGFSFAFLGGDKGGKEWFLLLFGDRGMPGKIGIRMVGEVLSPAS